MGVTESLQVYGTEMNNLKILNRHSIFYQNNTYYKNNLLYIKNKIKHTKIKIPKLWHYPAIPAIYIKKKQARKTTDEDKTPKSTNPHPFGALIDDYIH